MKYVWAELPALFKKASLEQPGWVASECICKSPVAKDATILPMLHAAGLKKKHLQASFENAHSLDAEHREKIKKLEASAKNFEVCRNRGTNFLLIGSQGTGKTYLAVAFLKEVVKQGYSCGYHKAGTLLTRLKETWGGNATEKASDVIKKMLSYDLLVIDDIGRQHDSLAERELLYQIIDGRYEEERPTMVTTMREFDQLQKVIGSEIVDRLTDRNTGSYITLLKFRSFRQENLNHGGN